MRIHVFALLLATCSSCNSCNRPPTPTPSAPDQALSNAAATHFAGLLTRTGTDARVEGNHVLFHGHTLVTTATPGPVMEQQGHALATVEISLELDGRPEPALRVNAMAFDANRGEAQQRAVREWLVSAGVPLVDALRSVGFAPSTQQDAGTGTPDGGVAPAGLQLGRYAVFPGPTGLRGEVPPVWRGSLPPIHQPFLDRLTPQLGTLLPANIQGRFHTLRFTLHIRNGSMVEGECRIDAQVTPALCSAVRDFSWPQGQHEFLFRQFYLLATPGTAPSPQNPSATP